MVHSRVNKYINNILCRSKLPSSVAFWGPEIMYSHTSDWKVSFINPLLVHFMATLKSDCSSNNTVMRDSNKFSSVLDFSVDQKLERIKVCIS